MNTVRPLVTIAILVVVGAFLYVKINQGPVRQAESTSSPWANGGPQGVPALSTLSSEAPTDTAQPASETAPPWSADAPRLSADLAEPGEALTTEPAAESQAEVPAMPELPAVAGPPADSSDAAPPQVAQSTDPVAGLPPLPTTLPANIPTAQYPDQMGSAPATAEASAPGAPPLAMNPALDSPEMPPTSPVDNQGLGSAGSPDDGAATSPPATAMPQPQAEVAATPPTVNDRYGMSAATPAAQVPPVVETPVPSSQPFPTSPAIGPSFATTWPTIQATLDRGQLAEAHQMLSKWHDDSTLTPTDAELVDNLLSQLAGTVVYSTEHLLEPARTVQAGETLETIAREYNVPWQLLAKINGVAAPNQLQPGQELKVVRGPFSAVVDLGRKRITLLLDERYAGRIPFTVPSASGFSDGEWLVDQKLANSASDETQSAYASAPASADRAIVLRSATATGGTAAAVTIASGTISAKSTAAGAPVVQVSPQDAEDLSDILSIGSRVVVRR